MTFPASSPRLLAPRWRLWSAILATAMVVALNIVLAHS